MTIWSRWGLIVPLFMLFLITTWGWKLPHHISWDKQDLTPHSEVHFPHCTCPRPVWNKALSSWTLTAKKRDVILMKIMLHALPSSYLLSCIVELSFFLSTGWPRRNFRFRKSSVALQFSSCVCWKSLSIFLLPPMDCIHLTNWIFW